MYVTAEINLKFVTVKIIMRVDVKLASLLWTREKSGSLKSNLTPRSDRKILIGQVMVVIPQAYNVFSKRFTFALSKLGSFFLCI